MTNKVYEVLGCSGENEDYYEATIFTTKDKIKAEEYCKEYNEINEFIVNIEKVEGFNNYFYDDSHARVKELTILDNINSPKPSFKFDIYIGDNYVEFAKVDSNSYWSGFEWTVNIDSNPSIFETIIKIDDKDLTLTVIGCDLYDIKNAIVEEISKLNNKNMLEFYLEKLSKVYIELEKVE